MNIFVMLLPYQQAILTIGIPFNKKSFILLYILNKMYIFVAN